GRRRRRQHMAVSGRQLDDQRRPVFGNFMIVGGVIRQQYLGDAGDLRRRLGRGEAVLASDENMDVAAGSLGDFARGSDGVQRRRLHRLVIVLGDDKDRHQITRASFFSLSTSSVTEPTLTPPCRFAGSSTFSVARRGVTSTPSSSGVIEAIGFFFAFMMLG